MILYASHRALDATTVTGTEGSAPAATPAATMLKMLSYDVGQPFWFQHIVNQADLQFCSEPILSPPGRVIGHKKAGLYCFPLSLGSGYGLLWLQNRVFCALEHLRTH